MNAGTGEAAQAGVPTRLSPTERRCDRCRVDQTPLETGLNEQRNAHGVGLGLFCPGCIVVVKEAVMDVDRRHGATITQNGGYLSSPRGTPRDPAAYWPLWAIPGVSPPPRGQASR